MNKTDKIFIAGASGMVGSAIIRALVKKGHTNLIGSIHSKTLAEQQDIPLKLVRLDLIEHAAVNQFFKTEKPVYVFLAAAKVGGIHANNAYPAEFIHDNLLVQTQIIHASHDNRVKRLLFLGSSCIYPKHAPQPMKEDHLLTGLLEPTNEPYAIAKISGIKTCEAYNRQYGTRFLAVMPTNLYGPNDNFHLKNSHVLPGMMRKMYLASCLENNDMAAIRADFGNLRIEGIPADSPEENILNFLADQGINRDANGKVSLSLWGTGTPLREFLHVSDMADACVFVMENINFDDLKPTDSKEIRNTHINIGSGKEITIRQLAELIQRVTGFKGELLFDASKPDGTMRKLLDVSKLEKLGWKSKIELEDGVQAVFESYLG